MSIRTLANVAMTKGGEIGHSLYRQRNKERNRHGKLGRVTTKEKNGEGARTMHISERNEVQVQDKISLKAKNGS